MSAPEALPATEGAQRGRKDLLRFITCGGVDDGKSTLIGRMLYDAGLVPGDHLEALRRDSLRYGHAGKGQLDFSLLVDGLGAEREQGITIDVAYRYFATPRRKFILADTPGHEQYTRNMATGASTANLAVILIDAQHGVLPQTRRHSFIASLLGIRHVLVAVNKMDLVGYAQDVFDAVRADYADFASRLETADLHFIPVSAIHGDNVVHRSENMPWYGGAPLLNYLETVHIASDQNLIDMRFPVQYVLRPDEAFRGYCGTIVSGVLRRGDEVLALPANRRSRVKSIVTYDGELDEAVPPAAVTVTLEDDLDVSRGDLLVRPNNVPRSEQVFEAMVVWMSEDRLEPGRPYLLKHASGTTQATVAELRYKLNVNTLHREPAAALELNEIGRAKLATSRPLLFDAYKKNRGMGAFILIDRLDQATAGAGVLLDVTAAEETAPESRPVELTRQRSRVTPEARAARLGQTPFTVWLTGLPRSGKSTIAYALENALFEMGYTAYVLDGNNLRLGISHDLSFSGLDRAENLRRAAEVARLTAELGLITIAAFVSPFEADRLAARHLLGEGRFVEVFCDAPLEVCEMRDTTGLYARARSGQIREFTGIDAPYERPLRPEVVLQTATLPVEESCRRILAYLGEAGLLKRGTP
ncbi:MAG: sulfate adenylyltransferase subunit CysN [Acidobacteria bacterium]|nr:sulfate adenylyltransferase subunit CysN [Acidobacteriota bacterium]